MSTTPPDQHDEDLSRGAPGLAAEWTLVGCSCIIALLRFISQSLVLKKLRWDDALMAVALITAIGHAVVMTEAYRHGWGYHASDLPVSERIEATNWIFVSQGFGVVSPMFSGIAFCIFLGHTLTAGSSWKLYSLYVVSFLQLAINVANVVMIYGQCGVHVKALWGAEEATCLAPEVQTYYGYFQSTSNSLSDLYLTVLPAMIVWNLQLRVAVKGGLAVLLCLSFFAFIASIVKTYEIHILNERGDITYNFVDFVIWAALEINIVIIAASIPTLKPLFARARQPSGQFYGDYRLSGRVKAPDRLGRTRSYDGSQADIL